MSLPERVAKRIQQQGECLVWTGALNNKGYGSVSVSKHKTSLVHRYVYEQLVGPIAEGMTIDHLCMNKVCVNTDHLEVVTRSENSLRAARAHEKEALKQSGWIPPTEEEQLAWAVEMNAIGEAAFGDLWRRAKETNSQTA